MAQTGIGTCTECGKDDIKITVVDEVTMLCEDCLNELDYIECDNCNEFWLWDAIKFYNLIDGSTICEHCAELLLDDGDISEDDIESIDDYTV